MFLSEETGEVVKVMLDDFAQKEFELCRVFAEAGLGPTPLALQGPCHVPGGDLYCIRMEAIQHTLHGLLCAKTWRGLRHGLAPPEEAEAHRRPARKLAFHCFSLPFRCSGWDRRWLQRCS